MMKSFSPPSSKVSIFKYVLIGVAFVGLVGWNADLQRRLVDNADSHHEENIGKHIEVHSRHRRDASSSRQGSIPSGGAMFVRWGRRDCPNDDSELVYSGTVGASIYTETGGSGEYTCLTREPQYEKYTNALEGTAKIAGVEFETGTSAFFDRSKSPSGTLQDGDVVCAVCRSKVTSSQVMIPGRKDCYPGWRKEYWGYLMTGHYAHKAQYNWACVDHAPECDEKGAKNDSGGLMYHVQGVCGSLPCPNYVQGRELTCVVCTK
ncbi:uncharacterized protein LOC135496967 [Lineus longissimus]|uniref:uncharacterized protein LOC135496967 n=1 Tax=Lineus longissimus TaxID=88925 RepID=UPI002B4D00EC